MYTFEIDSPGKRKETGRKIKRNLGLLLITIIERKNAWSRMADYGEDIKENLPLCYDKASSSAINKVELFRKGEFEDVTLFKMDEVNEILNKQEEVPLRYKLVWGDFGDRVWYYIRGCKPV